MSDTQKSEQEPEQAQEPPPGGFGVLRIDDSLVQVIRHPSNAHMDEPKEEDKPTPDAA